MKIGREKEEQEELGPQCYSSSSFFLILRSYNCYDTKTVSRDWQRKKATRITDQRSEHWWDKVRSRNVQGPVCIKKQQSLTPALCPAQRFNCLHSTSCLMQCSCMALDPRAGKSAIWERVVRSLILPLCLRATFKWGLPTWILQHYIAVSLRMEDFNFWLDIKPSSS